MKINRETFKYREKLKYIGLIIIFVLLVIGIPLIIDNLIIGNSIKSNISNSDWVSFLGSYIGAILGGIFAFTTIYISIKNENKNHKEMMKLTKRGYINVEELYYTPNLIDFENNCSKKIILVEGYKEFLDSFESFIVDRIKDKKLDDDSEITEDLIIDETTKYRVGYDVIRNISDNPVFDLQYSVLIKDDSEDEKEFKIEVYLEMINPNEVYYIPIIKDRSVEDYRVKVKHYTIHSRTIIYRSSVGEFTKIEENLNEERDFLESTRTYGSKQKTKINKNKVNWFIVNKEFDKRFIRNIKDKLEK